MLIDPPFQRFVIVIGKVIFESNYITICNNKVLIHEFHFRHSMTHTENSQQKFRILATMFKPSSHEINSTAKNYTVHFYRKIIQLFVNLICQFWSKLLICINLHYPFSFQIDIIQCPVKLCSMVFKLMLINFRSE